MIGGECLSMYRGGELITACRIPLSTVPLMVQAAGAIGTTTCVLNFIPSPPSMLTCRIALIYDRWSVPKNARLRATTTSSVPLPFTLAYDSRHAGLIDLSTLEHALTIHDPTTSSTLSSRAFSPTLSSSARSSTLPACPHLRL